MTNEPESYLFEEGWRTEEWTARALKVKVQTMRNWKNQKVGPLAVKNGRDNIYHIDAIGAYLQAQVAAAELSWNRGPEEPVVTKKQPERERTIRRLGGHRTKLDRAS